MLFFLSNLGDGKVQPCVDDESEEEEEKGKNAQQGLLKHDDPRKRVTQLQSKRSEVLEHGKMQCEMRKPTIP